MDVMQVQVWIHKVTQRVLVKGENERVLTWNLGLLGGFRGIKFEKRLTDACQKYDMRGR
jgi:hypothetical protein